MDCQTARSMIQQGLESPDLLGHLASCDACRARTEATEFVRAPEARPELQPRPQQRSEQRAAVKPAAIAPTDRTYVPDKRGPSLLPWIVGGAAIVVIIGALTVIVLRRLDGRRKAAATAPAAAAAAGPTSETIVEDDAPAGRKLSIDSEPPGNVFVDGKRRGRTPIVLDVEPGKRHVEVRAEGYRTAKATVHVAEHDEKLHLVLERGRGGPGAGGAARPEAGTGEKGARGELPAAPAGDDPDPVADSPAIGGGMGLLSITTEPSGARVFLDGKDTTRSTPVIKMSVPVGKHHIELKSRSASVEFDTFVAKGREARINRTIAP